MVFLYGDVTEQSIANVINQLLAFAGASQAPIHLLVSTYGGSVDEMFGLYDIIKFLPCPVHTIGVGKIMSAGVLLLASGNKGSRLIGSKARIMMHSTSGVIYGNVFEIENYTKEHRRQYDLMINAVMKETKLSRKLLEEMMSSKVDRYLTPEEAVKFGIVDKIISDNK